MLPRLDSPSTCLQQSGPSAQYLITASLAAALRKPIGKGWRAIHILSYLAFLLATVHTTLLGTELAGSAAQHVVARIVSIALITPVIVALIHK